jgi:hypothetical protein
MLLPDSSQSGNEALQLGQATLKWVLPRFQNGQWLWRRLDDLVTSRHLCRSGELHRVPRWAFIKPVHLSFDDSIPVAILCLLFTKTRLTSRETVLGDGIYVPRHPVFIRQLNPRSATILNGRMLSATHRTISDLSKDCIHVLLFCFLIRHQHTLFPSLCVADASKSPSLFLFSRN